MPNVVTTMFKVSKHTRTTSTEVVMCSMLSLNILLYPAD